MTLESNVTHDHVESGGTDPSMAPRLVDVDLTSIRASLTNPRKHFAADQLLELADSMRLHGLAQPILLRPIETQLISDPAFEIVAGERRWRAATQLGWLTIPAMVRPLNDQQTLELQVVENLQREDLHPLEEAEGYERLMQEHGYTVESLASKVGKSEGYIYARLKLTALVPEARTAFYEGKLNPSMAILVARMTPAIQAAAVREVTTGDDGHPLSVRRTGELLRTRYMLDLRLAVFDTESAKLLPIAGPCTTCPKRTGNQHQLFADVSNADTCTDPTCFNDKKAMHWAGERTRLEKQKVRIVEGEEAKALAPWGTQYGQLQDAQTTASLVDRIQSACGLDEAAASARLQEVMTAQKIKPGALIVESGEIIRFLPTSERNKVMEAITPAASSDPAAKEREARNKAFEKEQAIEQRKRTLMNKFAGELTGALITAAEKEAPITLELLRLMVFSWWRQGTYDGENSGALLTRWAIEPIDGEEAFDFVTRGRAFFMEAEPPVLARCMLALACIDDDMLGAIDGIEYSLTAAARAYGVDVDGMRKTLVDDALDPPKKAKSVGAKYQNPQTGETWTGRGKKPRWVEAGLERGKQLEDFAIKAAAACE